MAVKRKKSKSKLRLRQVSFLLSRGWTKGYLSKLSSKAIHQKTLEELDYPRSRYR